MPYIITTHRHLNDPTAEFLPGALPGVSRLAVATLKEARTELAAAIDGSDYHRLEDVAALYNEAETLPADGGTIGPLPDGTEIVVERVRSAFPLVCAAMDAGTLPTPSGLRPHDPDLWTKIIAAYNEAYDTRRIA